MRDFATATHPIRASYLPGFLACPLSHILRTDTDMGSSEASETGTMVHKGADAFHKIGSEQAALAVMAHSRKELPLANTAKAKAAFQEYVKREKAWGEVIACEMQVTLRLPPSPVDSTQEEIVITGTLDQVRRHPQHGHTVCDIKTGSKTPSEMLNVHSAQLAAYLLGYGDAAYAAIIRTADFLSGGPGFHVTRWGKAGAAIILESVQHKVAQVRAGLSVRVPGKHCDYCPAGCLANCIEGKRATNNNPNTIRSVVELFK